MPAVNPKQWTPNTREFYNALPFSEGKLEFKTSRFGTTRIVIKQGTNEVAELTRRELYNLTLDLAKKCAGTSKDAYPLATAYKKVESLNALFTAEEVKFKKAHPLLHLLLKIRTLFSSDNKAVQNACLAIENSFKSHYNGSKTAEIFYRNAALMTEEATSIDKEDEEALYLKAQNGNVTALKDLMQINFRKVIQCFGISITDVSEDEQLANLQTILEHHGQKLNPVMIAKLYIEFPDRDSIAITPLLLKQNSPLSRYFVAENLLGLSEAAQKVEDPDEKLVKALQDKGLAILKELGKSSPNALQFYYTSALDMKAITKDELKNSAEQGDLVAMRIYAALLAQENAEEQLALLEKIASWGNPDDQLKYAEALKQKDDEKGEAYIEARAKEGISRFQFLKFNSPLRMGAKNEESLQYLDSIADRLELQDQKKVLHQLKYYAEDKRDEYLKRFAKLGNREAILEVAKNTFKNDKCTEEALIQAIQSIDALDKVSTYDYKNFGRTLSQRSEKVAIEAAKRYLLKANDPYSLAKMDPA